MKKYMRRKIDPLQDHRLSNRNSANGCILLLRLSIRGESRSGQGKVDGPEQKVEMRPIIALIDRQSDLRDGMFPKSVLSTGCVCSTVPTNLDLQDFQPESFVGGCRGWPPKSEGSHELNLRSTSLCFRGG